MNVGGVEVGRREGVKGGVLILLPTPLIIICFVEISKLHLFD